MEEIEEQYNKIHSNLKEKEEEDNNDYYDDIEEFKQPVVEEEYNNNDDSNDSIEYQKLLKSLIKDDIKRSPTSMVSTQRKYKTLSESERQRRSENCKRMREIRAQKLKERKLVSNPKKINREEYNEKVNKTLEAETTNNQIHQIKKQSIADVDDKPKQKYVPLYISGSLNPKKEPILPLYI